MYTNFKDALADISIPVQTKTSEKFKPNMQRCFVAYAEEYENYQEALLALQNAGYHVVKLEGDGAYLVMKYVGGR